DALVLEMDERLLAHAIAREEQRALAPVPGGEGKHALEARAHLAPPPAVAVHDRLGVGAREETLPGALELGAQLLVVVDLSVEHDLDASVAASHRLVAGRE